MFFESYREWKVYNSQSSISFPRSTDKVGFGNAVFLITPSMDKSIEFIVNDRIDLKKSYYKYYTIDSRYKEKIGRKNLVLNEKRSVSNTLENVKDMPLQYLQEINRKAIIKTKKNLVVDLGMWMDLFFRYSIYKSPRDRCETFLNFLSKRINDSMYSPYTKRLLVIDIESWVSRASNCIIMSPKLLNNPLSILIYSMVKYPELISNNFSNMSVFIVNKSSGQLFLAKIEDFKKDNYPELKTRLKTFKGVAISVEDEGILTEEEITANKIDKYKQAVIKATTAKLLGDNTEEDYIEDDIDGDIIEDDISDITGVIITDEDDTIEDKDEEILSIDNLDEDTLAEINKLLSKDITNEDLEKDAEIVADKIADTIENNVYVSSFKSEKTTETELKIKELIKAQDLTLGKPNRDDAKSKIIDETDYSDIINTNNTNILKSKFVNFDKGYVEKKLESDIDDAVSCLSKAGNGIYVIDKDVVDTSDTQSLKKTYTYTLMDEKGIKSTLKFDVPVIIDDNYIFINGSKKVITHQFILKPLVKTGADTVQLVTFYNKVYITRDGKVDQISNRILVYLSKNIDKYKVISGTTTMKNKAYNMSLDMYMYCKLYSRFTIKDYQFMTDIDELVKTYSRRFPNMKITSTADKFPIAYNTKNGQIMYLNSGESYSAKIIDMLKTNSGEDILKEIQKVKRKPRLVYVRAKLMGKYFPIILVMLYCEGFDSIMKKANIDYKIVDKNGFKEYRNNIIYDNVKLANDEYIVWDNTKMSTSLLMNGLKRLDMSIFTKEELESKDTYRFLVQTMYGDSSIFIKLDQFHEFTIDDVSREVLIDMGYPTDLMELLILAISMLCDTHYLPETDMENMRIRSTEVIPNIIYKVVSDAYNPYRKTMHKKKPNKVSMKQSAVIDILLSSDTNLVEEASVINPVLEMEKNRVVTFKGLRGTQLDRAMTLSRRGFDQSMVGVVGISTSPDANVGVNRQLTMEPMITSTRGYIDPKGKYALDDLNQTNLLDPGEMLTPLGVIFDDPDRTAMTYKQAKYAIAVEDSSPVLVGNRMETLLPYYLSDEFVVDAKEDGKVVDITDDYVIIQYKSGKYYSIDVSNRIRKNASAGFFVRNDLTCNLKKGDKFKRGDILAYNDKAFTMNNDNRTASMNLGVLCKMAITNMYDCYEDSAPITKKLAERLATTMLDEKVVVLEPTTYIKSICKVGDKVSTGDTLMVFEETDDAEFAELLQGMRQEYKEELIESSRSKITAKHTGEIAGIKIYTTVDLEDMDPTLAKIVKNYQDGIKKKIKVLEKYSNPGDMANYKSGQVIDESYTKVSTNKSEKFKGEYAKDKVIIIFYTQYRDVAAKGDKICAEFALKGVTSHVIEEGKEPRSEYRPEEEISTLVAPLSVTARKVPSIFITMFTNKLILEAKRQLKDMYLKD